MLQLWSTPKTAARRPTAKQVNIVYRPGSRRVRTNYKYPQALALDTGNLHAYTSTCLKFIFKIVGSRINYLIRWTAITGIYYNKLTLFAIK